MSRITAVADIGSNTAHLLVGTVTNCRVKRLANQSVWLDLGQHVREHGEFRPEKVQAIIVALKHYKKVATALGDSNLYCFATQAMREAVNSDFVLKKIEKEAKVKVNVISAEEEATYSCRAISSEFPDVTKAVMVEIGGGSVQVATWEQNKLKSLQSLPLGTGFLAARVQLTHPSEQDQIDQLEAAISEHCASIQPREKGTPVILCGGVTRGIWRALHPDGDPVLHVKELDFLTWDCRRLTGTEIASRYRVKPKRALTLATGSRVLSQILNSLGTESATVCQFGVREGAILSLASS
ncbi:hypothetical protein QPK87_05715 [Kamptonema cortianum]|nr:hypothetical protein [Geitlerinema splendidum]MDK3156072.1 hypothetical protein [Kamptonema cortianum]